MHALLSPSWQSILNEEFKKSYFITLGKFVKQAYEEHRVFPPKRDLFNAFNLCPFESIKVVIIGQDPYHGFGQAHGLCFSVNDGVKFPPSLRNIFKELESDLNTPPPLTGNLERWAKQGVLLLNATLTVEENQASSHQKKGWETFTHEVIQLISERHKNCVFLLWGAFAQQKAAAIDSQRHLILQSAHPSPLSAYRGFFGNHHFSKANSYLVAHNKAPIEW